MSPKYHLRSGRRSPMKKESLETELRRVRNELRILKRRVWILEEIEINKKVKPWETDY